MTEMPTFCVFPEINITQMVNSHNLHVFVVPKETAEGFTPPEDIDAYPDSPGYAGTGTIFGLFPPGGCEACKYRPPFDVSVDITAALRANGLRKANASIVVMVENAVEGTVEPLSSTPVPPPEIRGPMFETKMALDVSTEGENYAPDVEAMQTFLVAKGYKSNGVVDGAVGDATVEAIRAFQAANGLTVDGVAGPAT